MNQKNLANLPQQVLNNIDQMTGNEIVVDEPFLCLMILLMTAIHTLDGHKVDRVAKTKSTDHFQ